MVMAGPPTTMVLNMANTDEGGKATRYNAESRQHGPAPSPRQPPTGSVFPDFSNLLTPN